MESRSAGHFADVTLQIAQQTRTLMWIMSGFVLTVWLSILVPMIA